MVWSRRVKHQAMIRIRAIDPQLHQTGDIQSYRAVALIRHESKVRDAVIKAAAE